MATMATQGPWLRIASVSQPKPVTKSTELGFLTSQLSGVRISHSYSDVINRTALPSAPSLQPIVARTLLSILIPDFFLLGFNNLCQSLNVFLAFRLSFKLRRIYQCFNSCNEISYRL
ncbi:hypothetical protein CARUB_v10010690mg [Capsella rubella]|uniref:Uncharacterized protein n=1 Tax=Capsella rubella TaxID=81985 RepID=R0IJL8_9BRAS|nr:hypothetical protein CARUB_v10010690mg [Capsella rubella]